MKKQTPLQIEMKSAQGADYVMVEKCEALNRAFTIGLALGIVFLLTLGCLIGHQVDEQLSEIPYVWESPELPASSEFWQDEPFQTSQTIVWDAQAERLARAQYVLNRLDQLWSEPYHQ